MRSEQFYISHLQKYFNSHYSKYEDTARWYVNPDINVWKFDIPELYLTITLTCCNDGKVIERREK